MSSQARFALTTAGSWDHRNGEFDYSLFHHKITDLFHPDEIYHDEVWAATTLEWWNMYVFIAFYY
jgi:hypothetical protein